jgi:hypothetical protein
MYCFSGAIELALTGPALRAAAEYMRTNSTPKGVTSLSQHIIRRHHHLQTPRNLVALVAHNLLYVGF